ncbi:MAG: nucleotidyltransferase family protein [Candidatus Helarchaeota archaeon]
MLTSIEILERIEKNREKIRQFGAEKIGIFGSYIRNEQKPESDIDIIVGFKKGMKTFDNYMDLKFFLEDLLDYKVDLVVIEAIKPDLKVYILENVKYAAGI